MITCEPVVSIEIKLEKNVYISKVHHSRHTISIEGIAILRYSRIPLKESLDGKNQASFNSVK